MARAPFSEAGNPLTAYVNLWQTKEERQGKYWLCRSLGVNSSWATRMRDWHLTKVELFLRNFYGLK